MSSKNKYSITLSWNNQKNKLKIPVLPESVPVEIGSKNETINIIELGELIMKGTPLIKKISFSSIFPVNDSPLVSVKKLLKPKEYARKIQSLSDNKVVVKLVIEGMGIAENVLITSFKYHEEGGDVGTFYYSISFSRYTKPVVRKLVKTSSKKVIIKKVSSSKSHNTTKGSTYTVVKGDCLWLIAQKKLKDGTKWTKIWDLNASTIINTAKKYGVVASKSNPMIYPGTVLRLPS